MVTIDCGKATLTVDATLTQVACRSVEVTKFPVEDGSTISDHAIVKPDTYRLEGVISDTPVMSVRESDNLLDMTSEEVEAAIPWEPLRAATARANLESFVGKACTVGAGAEVLSNMVLETVEFPIDGTTGDSLRFSASFVRVITVASETAPIPKAHGGTKKKGGKKPTENADGPVKEKTSAAKGLYDWIRGPH